MFVPSDGECPDDWWWDLTRPGTPALHDPRVRPVPCPFDCGYAPKLMPAVIEANFRKHILEFCPVVKEMRVNSESDVRQSAPPPAPEFGSGGSGEGHCSCACHRGASVVHHGQHCCAPSLDTSPSPSEAGREPESNPGLSAGHTPIVEYDSGMRRTDQSGKPDYTLLDLPMLKRWAIHMTKGAETHGRENWRNAHTVEDLQRFRTSAFRHFLQWLEDEQDEDHASALFFNVAGAEMVKQKMASDESFR